MLKPGDKIYRILSSRGTNHRREPIFGLPDCEHCGKSQSKQTGERKFETPTRYYYVDELEICGVGDNRYFYVNEWEDSSDQPTMHEDIEEISFDDCYETREEALANLPEEEIEGPEVDKGRSMKCY